MKKVDVVISVYNEEGNIGPLHGELLKVESELSSEIQFNFIYVNDGSADNSLSVLKKIQQQHQNINIIDLYRNFGHENAMRAGLDNSTGDCVIFMDSDFQHPPSLIPKLITMWLDGADVVLTRKINFNKDRRFYNFGKNTFFRFLNRISDIHVDKNYPDFRLLDKKYLPHLKSFSEDGIMFRSMLNYVGIKNFKCIDFVVPERLSGDSKYKFYDSIALAVDAFVQFSTSPLRLSFYLGVVSMVVISIIALYTLYQYTVTSTPVPGYTTIVLVVGFIGSIQMLILSILGEYIGRIHIKTKMRNLYFGDVLPSTNKKSE